jgi:hypothetical protein
MHLLPARRHAPSGLETIGVADYKGTLTQNKFIFQILFVKSKWRKKLPALV